MTWRLADGLLHLRWASMPADAYARLARHQDVLAELGRLGEATLEIGWEQWAQLGRLPQTDETELLADWSSLHDVLAEVLGIERQEVEVRSVGHVGADRAS